MFLDKYKFFLLCDEKKSVFVRYYKFYILMSARTHGVVKNFSAHVQFRRSDYFNDIFLICEQKKLFFLRMEEYHLKV